MDIIVFKDQYTYLSTVVLQFGSKRCSSTTICTALILDIINYNHENGCFESVRSRIICDVISN